MLTSTAATATTIVAEWDPVRAENVRRAQLYDAMLVDVGGDLNAAAAAFAVADTSMESFYRQCGPLTFTLTAGRLTRVSVATRADPGTPVFVVNLAHAPRRQLPSPVGASANHG